MFIIWTQRRCRWKWISSPNLTLLQLTSLKVPPTCVNLVYANSYWLLLINALMGSQNEFISGVPCRRISLWFWIRRERQLQRGRVTCHGILSPVTRHTSRTHKRQTKTKQPCRHYRRQGRYCYEVWRLLSVPIYVDPTKDDEDSRKLFTIPADICFINYTAYVRHRWCVLAAAQHASSSHSTLQASQNTRNVITVHVVHDTAIESSNTYK